LNDKLVGERRLDRAFRVDTEEALDSLSNLEALMENLAEVNRRVKNERDHAEQVWKAAELHLKRVCEAIEEHKLGGEEHGGKTLRDKVEASIGMLFLSFRATPCPIREEGSI